MIMEVIIKNELMRLSLLSYCVGLSFKRNSNETCVKLKSEEEYCYIKSCEITIKLLNQYQNEIEMLKFRAR